MWKPGSSKPSSSSSPSSPSSFAALSAPTKKTTASRPDPGRRRGQGAEQEEDEADPQQQHSRASKSPSEPLRTKALSGATLNMRFMKRKGGGVAASSGEEAAAATSASLSASRKNSSSPQRPEEPVSASSTTKTPTSAVASLRFLNLDSPSRRPPTSSPGNSFDDGEDVEMTDALDDERRRQGDSDHGDGGDHSYDDLNSPQHRPRSRVEAAVPRANPTGFEAATPLDMYGGRGNVLGRRSFGKFNPVVEANWSASIRHAGGEGSDNGDEDRSRRTKAKQRGGRQQERPIGNLDSKVPRSSSNRGRSQGKKRKTMISDVS